MKMGHGSKKLHDTGFGNDVLNMTLETRATEGKNRLDVIKMKNFVASKDIINQVNGQPTEWEKILANHLSDKGC